MLVRTSSLGDFDLEARDGAIGAVRDCLFEDTDWTLRWLVVDTGSWLPGRRVLLAPGQVDTSAADRRRLSLGITREQVRHSPPLDAEAPVSRHYEARLISHYGWPDYGLGLAAPAAPVDPAALALAEQAAHADPHLRSTAEMTGYHIHARDGRIGHIDLLDPEGWVLRYLVVDTRDWWPGKQVLVVPAALTGVSWSDRSADVDLTREQVRNAPQYDPSQTVDRAWEQQYMGYFGYPVYW